MGDLEGGLVTSPDRFKLHGEIARLRTDLEYVTKQRDYLAQKLDEAMSREARLVSAIGTRGPSGWIRGEPG